MSNEIHDLKFLKSTSTTATIPPIASRAAYDALRDISRALPFLHAAVDTRESLASVSRERLLRLTPSIFRDVGTHRGSLSELRIGNSLATIARRACISIAARDDLIMRVREERSVLRVARRFLPRN